MWLQNKVIPPKANQKVITPKVKTAADHPKVANKVAHNLKAAARENRIKPGYQKGNQKSNNMTTNLNGDNHNGIINRKAKVPNPAHGVAAVGQTSLVALDRPAATNGTDGDNTRS